MAMMNFCQDCHRNTDIVIDNRAGYNLCSECGLVLKFNHIEPECPNSPDSSENREENESTENSVSEIENLSTYFSNPYDSIDRIVRTPKRGLKLIRGMADRLGLNTAIKDRACEIYNKVDILKTCRGRSMNSILAACLFIACREIRFSRTLNEISAVANGVAKKEINRAVEAIKKQLEVETRTLLPGELVRRFCSKLGMENQAVMAVQEAVRKAEELDIRRSPNSILAAIIYVVIQLSDDQVSVKDIAVATEVTELTIRKSYKDIFLNASRIIPRWYACEEDIKRIPVP